MSFYGYDRLEALTREDIELRLHTILTRKDANGQPDVMTVADLKEALEVMVDAMIQLDRWVAKNEVL